MTELFNAKPFIIAEIGSNWTGFSECIDSIGMAKSVGANAVKFQLFSAEGLYGFVYPTRGELPPEWLPKLAEHAKALGIEFMCTAFSPELVEAVDPFVSVHKIASSDLSYPQLLKAVAKTGKPIILSTGGSSLGDVHMAVDCLGSARDRTVLMYCNAAYPSTHHNLFKMQQLEQEFRMHVGFSDHSQDVIYAPLAALIFHRATVIEKHVTAFPLLDTSDREHSLTADDFKIMVDHLRGTVSVGEFNPSREEKPMFLRHNRRLIASKDITPGEPLAYGVNYGAFRSLKDDANGLTPFLWNHANYGPEGKRALTAIKQGDSLGPGAF